MDNNNIKTLVKNIKEGAYTNELLDSVPDISKKAGEDTGTSPEEGLAVLGWLWAFNFIVHDRRRGLSLLKPETETYKHLQKNPLYTGNPINPII